ncbi:hypothetical protein ABC304_11310 [Microbacterium sp. 1P10UB]|uniref:hypothetical protein n=1 Tax=unclassified Microbacterium TaxID=2609290 RepID=UPI0039A00AD3
MSTAGSDPEKGADAREWVQSLEPGVDAEHLAGSAAVAQTPTRSASSDENPADGHRAPVWTVVVIVFSVVAIAVLAFLVPVSAAPAWLGIAVQVGCLAWAAAALVRSRGRSRRARGVPIVFAAQVAVTLVLLLLVGLVAWNA